MKKKIIIIKRTGRAYYATKVPNGWELIKRAPEHDKPNYLRAFGEATYHASGVSIVTEPIKGFIRGLFS